ncbi:MAG: hypothetical protein ACO263_09650 [Cyclobacteriaceae bacterium]
MNLKDLLDQKPQPLVEVEQIKVEVIPATSEAIEEAWKAYADKKKEMAAEHLLLQRPKTVEGRKVTLTLANAVEAQLLNSLKTEMMTFLREQCQDPEIAVEHFLEQNEVARPAYTGREKLEKLIEKYPAVQEFKERFGLDPEF